MASRRKYYVITSSTRDMQGIGGDELSKLHGNPEKYEPPRHPPRPRKPPNQDVFSL